MYTYALYINYYLGRPMRITNASIISAVAAAAPVSSGRRGNLRGGNSTRDSNTRDNTRRDNSSRGGRGGGSGRRENRPKPSQQDLDAEMDSYMGSANNEDIQMN